MGRPIKKKFFGNLNAPYQDQATGGPTGQGGEGVASSITVSNSGTNYSQGSVAVFSSPQLPGGVVAAGTLSISAPGAGGVTGVSLTSAGTGYTGTATITITTATGVTKVSTGSNLSTSITVASTSGIFIGMTVTGNAGLGGAGNATKVTAIGEGTVTVANANDNTFTGVTLAFADLGSGFQAITSLTSAADNSIVVYAYVPGGSSGVLGDIMKQESSRRYLVKTAQGQGQCKLVAKATGSLLEGEMNITARDTRSPASTYYVTKLTAHRATLTRATNGGSGYEYADGEVAGWTLNGASTGVVSITNN